MKRILAVLVAAVSLALIPAAGTALADGSPARTIFHSDMFILKNPDGASIEFGVKRRWAYGEDRYGTGEMPYMQGGVFAGVNPSYTQVGVASEWMHAPFLILQLRYDYYIFSGTNGFLTSFPSGDSAFGDRELEAMAGEEEYGTGHRILLKPVLRAKAGRLMFINETAINYFVFNGDGPYFREGQYDTLVKKGGDFVYDNLTIFPVEVSKSGKDAALYAGPFYNVTHAEAADLTRRRAGLALYWIPYDRLWGLDRPRAYSLLGRNIRDRNRDDELFFIVAFGFDIEL